MFSIPLIHGHWRGNYISSYRDPDSKLAAQASVHALCQIFSVPKKPMTVYSGIPETGITTGLEVALRLGAYVPLLPGS